MPVLERFSQVLPIFGKKISSYIPLLILAAILCWFCCSRFYLTIINSLLFIPNEQNVSNEVLDILMPATLLFFSSFFISKDFLVIVSNVVGRSNINISLFSKLVIFLVSFIFFPIFKSFRSSDINGAIIDIVGYPSSYFSYFENVVFSIFLVMIFVIICFLFNLFILFFSLFFIVFKKSFLDLFGFKLKHGVKVSVFGYIRVAVFFVLIMSNIYLFVSVYNGITFLLSPEKGSKEITELLLVTSYNEIPNRCNLLLDSYGKKENALLAFIDKDSVSLYIIKENKFINESCR